MRINNNIMALNAHRQLAVNQSNAAKSMERLSSGLRINRAGDDAAGLAISEKMRGQIRGLKQAARNAQDGISLIQTAEGALNEIHSILQRMRELANQAANDTNTDVDRSEIQKEINELTSEINRIGNTTEFNTMRLLDGSKSNQAVVEGSTVQKTVVESATYEALFALGVDNTSVTGEVPTFMNGTEANQIGIATGEFAWDAIDPQETNELTITKTANGLKVEIAAQDDNGNTLAVTDDFAQLVDGSYVYDAHGISFSISEADFAAMNDGDFVAINLSVASGADTTVDSTASVAGSVATKSTWTHEDTNGAPSDAKIDGGLKIDGSKIMEGAARVEIAGADLDIDGDATITVRILGAEGAELSSDEYVFAVAADTQNWTYDNHGVSFTLTHSDAVAFEFNQVLDTSEQTVSETEDNSLALQIGANEAQALNLSMSDMRSVALGISSTTAGNGFASTMGVTDGTDSALAEYALDVSTHDSASQALTTLDAAVERVSAERSMLGATQNRLEHTISNLGTSAENLQAAESRIRDLDMAEEIMAFTKNNILQQAATAMLAQANMAPQSVLQLLG